jgi:hypothetical protein
MADDTTDDLTITIYALGDTGSDGGRPVPADVFVRKVQELLEALREADKGANQGIRYDYVVADLKRGSAQVTLAEKPISEATFHLSSPFAEFEHCLEAVRTNDISEARRHNGLVEKIAKFASGAGDKFAYIEVERGAGRDYRADGVLLSQAKEMVDRLKLTAELPKPSRMFQGQSFEGFDGTILEVDFRHKTPRGKLVLSDRTKELDCEFVGFSLEEIKDHIKCRVWAEGLAIYGGEGGLPKRLDVKSLRKIVPKHHPSRWRGKVSRSAPEDWLD